MEPNNIEAEMRYNVDEINAVTEEDSAGNLGKPLYLLPGFAEVLIDDESEPDVFCRRLVKTESGWEIDYNLSGSFFYVSNSTQTTVARVSKRCDDGEILNDYYQVPYSEVVPRIISVMKDRLGTDERWFVAQTNNIQLEGWLQESGAMCLTKRTLDLLD